MSVKSTNMIDDKGVKKTIELSSVEIKPASVAEDAEAIQLNKNIRISKSILYNIVTHMGEYDDNCYVLGIDIIGLSAFIYTVYQYEDIIVAVKIEEDNIFLPGDVDDLEDLVFGSTVDQLLNFKKSIIRLCNDINKASKKYKKRRISSKTSGSINPRLQSPPRRAYAFPENTFYLPKRK
ncbi:hypothetical protein G6F37_007201 [Rhizopus arrhizus]|nr:hypothetical protein G6F38_009030 [Rhizopus arrhizus]KAG1156884.1 hypothetical protein G6F37_007201 [Rhizopus arrhizus]